MQIKTLNHVDFSDLVDCFNESFADYSVKMPTATAFWKNRWKAARVDYDLSFGMFDEEKLVGFIVNGIDIRKGFLTAFNSGTGVLPAYRGRKIVKQLYDFSIPVFLKKGIACCALEVIVDNEKAIKAYKSVGFEIVKTLKCYSGDLQTDSFENIKLLQVPFEEIAWGKLKNQEFVSWDFQKSAIKIIKDSYEFYNVFERENKIGFVILNPQTGTIAQFDLIHNSDELDWQKLFSGVKGVSGFFKINNIDDRQKTKIDAVEKAGLKNTIDQYEMEYFIN